MVCEISYSKIGVRLIEEMNGADAAKPAKISPTHTKCYDARDIFIQTRIKGKIMSGGVGKIICMEVIPQHAILHETIFLYAGVHVKL